MDITHYLSFLLMKDVKFVGRHTPGQKLLGSMSALLYALKLALYHVLHLAILVSITIAIYG